jgi:hypothetical protein
MELFLTLDQVKIEESFERFERAAAKGHEESIWILSLVKDVWIWSVWQDVDVERDTLKEAFDKTETPLGWFFAGLVSEWESRERFDFMKKSAEGGCSWGQVQYGMYFRRGVFVEQDDEMFLEWTEKAANQNNPVALCVLATWFNEDEEGSDKEKVFSLYRAAADLGWKLSMNFLAALGGERDLRQAVIWLAKGSSEDFWNVAEGVRKVVESDQTKELDGDFNQIFYTLGWGLYWYQYGSKEWNERTNEEKAFDNRCLDYYCSCVELQQKSIFTFLLCWNLTTGIKGPGQMIAQMVWEQREDNVVEPFEEPPRRSARLKRIKK